MQADHPMTDYAKPVQVCSVQTLEKRTVEKPDLVIVDECHRRFAVINRLLEEWPDVPFIGLSATPWSKGLGRYFDNLIISGTTKELIKRKLLSGFVVYAPSHPDLSGVKTVQTPNGADYAEGELSAVMREGTLTADIVSTWMERGRARPWAADAGLWRGPRACPVAAPELHEGRCPLWLPGRRIDTGGAGRLAARLRGGRDRGPMQRGHAHHGRRPGTSAASCWRGRPRAKSCSSR